MTDLLSLYWGVLVIADAMTVCAGLNPGNSGPDHGDVERTQLVVQLLQQATYAFEGLPRSTKNGESCNKTLDRFVAFNGGRCVFVFFYYNKWHKSIDDYMFF